MRWRALGQRLLWRGASWVRDRADRVLIRLRAREASGDEASDRDARSASPNGREVENRDRLAPGSPGGDAVPQHWRARVATGAPRHWLQRIEAARRRLKIVWIDAVARPKAPSSSPPADDWPPLELPPDRPRSHEGPVFEPASARPQPVREEEVPAATPHRSAATVERDPADRPSRPGPARWWGFVKVPEQRAGSTESTPAAREAGQRPRRSSFPAVEPFGWSTPPRGEGVGPPHRRQNAREESASSVDRAAAVHPFRWDSPVTSSAADDLAWADVATPVREHLSDPPRGASSEPARPRADAKGERPLAESKPAWPLFLTPDPWQRSTAQGRESDVVAVPSSAASEEAFYTNEPVGRWPALPEAPSTDDEDWAAMKRRLERLDRLDREQRGW